MQISVIIPVFNRKCDLARALQSLANQTDKAFEVVVCDDGSTEDIEGLCHKFKANLQLHYTRIENSGGPARPRNIAASLAKGEWLSFLDSDDFWLPYRIARIRPFLLQATDIVHHPLIEMTEKGPIRQWGRFKYIGRNHGHDPLRHMLVLGNPLNTSATLVRKAVFESAGGFCESPALIEDFDLWLRLAETGFNFVYVPTSLGYRWHSDERYSVPSPRQFEMHQTLFERHLELAPAHLKAAARSSFSYCLAGLALTMGDIGLARRYFSDVNIVHTPRCGIKAYLKQAHFHLSQRRSPGDLA